MNNDDEANGRSFKESVSRIEITMFAFGELEKNQDEPDDTWNVIIMQLRV